MWHTPAALWPLFFMSCGVSNDTSEAEGCRAHLQRQFHRGERKAEAACHFWDFLEARRSLQETLSCQVGLPQRKYSKR